METAALASIHWHDERFKYDCEARNQTVEQACFHHFFGKNEITQVMKNIKAILTDAGLTFENILKASVFVKDMNMYSRINAVYAEYFDESTAPARELVEVANLPKFVNIEISVIAVHRPR